VAKTFISPEAAGAIVVWGGEFHAWLPYRECVVLRATLVSCVAMTELRIHKADPPTQTLDTDPAPLAPYSATAPAGYGRIRRGGVPEVASLAGERWRRGRGMGWGVLREGRKRSRVVVVVANGHFGRRFAASAEQDLLPWP
jgi:hypothetical protein